MYSHLIINLILIYTIIRTVAEIQTIDKIIRISLLIIKLEQKIGRNQILVQEKPMNSSSIYKT